MNVGRMRYSYKLSLGKKTPILGKLVQRIGIVLLFLAGLSGSEDIIGKKCAYLSIGKTTIFQIDWSAQNGGIRMEMTSLNAQFRSVERTTRS